MSGFLAFATHNAKADVTYTWTTDTYDVASVTATFTLASEALTNPSTPVSTDFTSINVSILPPLTEVFPYFYSSHNLGFASDGTPVGPVGNNILFVNTISSTSVLDDLYFNLDTNWNVKGGETFGSDTIRIGGTGHWSIAPATQAVPEPSTAVVAVVGAVAFIAYGWSRHRRDQRRQGAA